MFSRRRFLKIVATSALGGVALALSLKDKIYRAVVVRSFIPNRQFGGVLTFEESELIGLSAFAAVLAGLSSKDLDFAAYAKPIIQQAAQELKGVGIALRKTNSYLNETSEARFHTLDQRIQEKVMETVLQPTLLNFLKWSKYRNLRIAEGVLLRIALNSPQSWARLGYKNYPGVFGNLRDYQYPPELSN